MRAFKAMYKTEFKLGIRQIDVPIFAFAFPVVVAIVLVLIYGKTDTVMMGKTFALASSIGIAAMGLMGLPLTLSGYREAKILKQLKVTPIKPAFILFVQFAVKFTLSLISAIMVWSILTVLFGYKMAGNPAIYFIAYVLVAFAIFGIGMIIASVSKDANMAGLLCSIAYFPMLIFSGTIIPLDALPATMVKVLQVYALNTGHKPAGNSCIRRQYIRWLVCHCCYAWY
ncbi:MAG: ABC transporter permease [Oscillospiraceae bacterium]